MSGYVAFDLDGTLAAHLKGGGVASVGAPILPMLELLKRRLAQGYEVRIVTARIMLGPGYQRKLWNSKQTKLIHTFLAEHDIPPLSVQCHKCFSMLCIYDDRAVAVEKGTGKLLSPDPLETE